MVTRRAIRWGLTRIARRLAPTVPLVGAGVALIALRSEVRRKGVVGGALNTLVDAIPFVGAAKNLIEMFRGDFIPDRRSGRHAISDVRSAYRATPAPGAVASETPTGRRVTSGIP